MVIERFSTDKDDNVASGGGYDCGGMLAGDHNGLVHAVYM